MVSDGWAQHAACRGADPDVFFSAANGAKVTAVLYRWCVGCPVQVPCRSEADPAGWRYGIRGAMTPDQRRDHDRDGSLPRAPEGCHWEWDEDYDGWQLVFDVGHERRQG